MRLFIRLLISVAMACVVTPALLLAAPLGPASAGSCPPPPAAADGTTQYVNDMKVKHLSCKQALKVAEAFQTCRHKNGPSGYCVKRIQKGFGCGEDRQSYGDYYSSSTTCSRKKGDTTQKVSFQYNQAYNPPAGRPSGRLVQR